MKPKAIRKKQTRIQDSILENIASLVGILIIVLVFHHFVAMGFVIPTGSMADTLRGDHFHFTCPRCGFEYNFSFNPQRFVDPRTGGFYREGFRPGYPVSLRQGRGPQPICPMCGHVPDINHPYYVNRGDQIWVVKCYYQFFEPKNWEAIVFKNPNEPSINYIKRLIAVPGQTVEIIDGDIYLNGTISRKPPKIQDTLWIKVFDNDFQPGSGKVTPGWEQPFQAEDASSNAWQMDQHTKSFTFAPAAEEARLQFSRDRIARFVHDFCSYNGTLLIRSAVVSDLKLSFTLLPQGPQGMVTVILGKYRRKYYGRVAFDGTCSILDGQGKLLEQQNIGPIPLDRPTAVSFAVVDHSLRLRVGSREVVYLGSGDPYSWGYRNDQRTPYPSIELEGKGDGFILKHIALYRDIHYTRYGINGRPGRATEGHPLTLGPDEFFVLGDNSPMSHDGRFWQGEGKRNGHKSFRPGIVPRDYLIGKPVFVYWPSGFRPHPKIRLPIIPNAGEIRLIH